MKRGPRNVICGALMGVTALLAPIAASAEELIDNYFGQIFPVEMISEYEKEKPIEILIEAEISDEEQMLYFAYATENFDKQDWSKKERKIPLPLRYTSINHNFTRIFILHPKEVKISAIEQMAYLVPQHEFEELRSLEESPKARTILKAGEMLLDWVLAKIDLPFINEYFDEFVEYSVEKEGAHYNKIFKKINEDYTITRIPSFPPDKFGGFTETARVYSIFFDISEAPEKEIPMCLWAKIALGNPSESYGELEGLVINFSLNEDW